MTLEDDDILDELNINRRTTLQGLAGALGTSIVGGSVASAQQSPQSQTAPELNPDQRWDEHLELAAESREKVQRELIEQIAEESSPNVSNDDADVVVRSPGAVGPGQGQGQGGSQEAYRPFVYSKALGYDSRLGISTDRHAEFIEAMVNAETSFPTGGDGSGDRPLIAPLTMNSHSAEGTDPWLGTMPPSYPSSNANNDPERLNTYLELLEVYATTYYNDVPLASLGDGPSDIGSAFANDRQALVSELESAGVGGPISDWIQAPTEAPEEAFRDEFYGCKTGPYITQHLAHEVDLYGPQATYDPTIAPITGDPYGATFEEFETIRGGGTPGVEPTVSQYDVGDSDFGPELADEERWAHTGKDLATYVRQDPTYIHYLNAAVQLLGWGAPIDDSMQYATSDNDIIPYIDGGAVSILDHVGRVCRDALLAGWHQKWRVHRRTRPESYSEKAVLARNEADSNGPPASAPPMSELLDFLAQDSETMGHVTENGFGDGLLPMAFPEGGPSHPAYPSGHSVIAGASVTALKTFMENVSYDELNVEPRVNTDGTDSGFEPVSEDLDVHGEINKYGSNVGMGRLFAGVHYRTDHVYGMLLGEQIAVATLYDQFVCSVGDRSGDQQNTVTPDGELTFTTLIGGEERTISPETFDDLRQAALDRAGQRP